MIRFVIGSLVGKALLAQCQKKCTFPLHIAVCYGSAEILTILLKEPGLNVSLYLAFTGDRHIMHE